MKRDSRLNSYLITLSKKSEPISKLYPRLMLDTNDADSLNENHFEVVPGLVHNFRPSVFWLLNGVCAAQCSFCERLPKGVGVKTKYNELSKKKADFDAAIEYIQGHPEISDVIFSGGDPLTSLNQIPSLVDQLSKIPI